MANEWEVVAVDGEAVKPYQPGATQEGAGLLERAGASFKSTPEGERSFFESQYGKGNARLTRDDEVEIRSDAKSPWRPVNPKGLDLGDVAGVAGYVPEAIGAALGAAGGAVTGFLGGMGLGAIPGAIAGGAGGAAGGNVVKQVVGGMLPGQEQESHGIVQRAGEVVGAGVLGGVGEGAGQLAYHGVIRPVAQSYMRGAMRGAAAPVAEAGAIERSINRGAAPDAVPFSLTPAEATGNKTLQMVEDAARKDVAGAELFAKRTAQDVSAMRDKALRMIDDIRAGARPASDLQTGSAIKTIFHEIDDNMLAALDDRATRDFAVLNTGPASRMRFDTPALKQTMMQLAEGDVNSISRAGPIAEGLIKMAADMPDRMTVNDMNLYLKRWGRMGYGKGDQTFMEKLGDTDRAKMGRMLFASLSKDVEDIATSGQAGHTLAKGLRTAKDNYKAGLQEIDAWQNDLFSKVVGDVGEESAARITDKLYKLNPDELKSVMTVVGYKPEVANAVRANWVERAFVKSQEKMMTRAGPGPWFDAEAFTKGLGDAKQIEALFGRSHREVLNDVIMMRRAVARMASRDFNSGSVAGQSKMMRVLGAVGSPGRWVETAKQILIPHKMTQILLDPGMRKNLELVANAKAPTQRVVAAITQLLGNEALDSVPQ